MLHTGLVAQEISTKASGQWPIVMRRARGRSLVDGSNLTESEIFFSNFLVECVNFYVIWSTNHVRVDSLNINTFEEKRTPRSTAHTVSSIFQICSKNYLQRSYIIVLFDAIPLNSVFLVARWSVLVYCNDLPFNWNKWRDPSLNHFEYPAIGWVLNNHSTGVSDSSSDSRQV